MNWAKQTTFSDGTTLSGSLNTRQSTSYTQEISISFDITGLPKKKLSLFEVLEFSSTGRYEKIDLRVWEEMFLLFEEVFKALPPTSLSDPQLNLFAQRRNHYAAFPDIGGMSYKAQAFSIIENISRAKKEALPDYIKIVEKHALKPRSVVDVESAFYLLNPTVTKQTENYRVAEKLISQYTWRPLVMPDKAMEDFYGLFYLAHTTKDEELLEKPLKELAEVSDFDRVISGSRSPLELPWKTVKYRNYLLDLPAKDVVYLSGKIPHSASAASALAISQRKLEERGEPSVVAAQVAHDAYTEVMPSVMKFNKPNLLANIYKVFMDNAHHTKLLPIFQSVVRGLEHAEEKEVARRATTKFEYLVGEKTNRWIKQKPRFLDILESMSEVMPADKVVAVINEVIEAKEPLTSAQWEKYIQNFDTFGDMPLSWWQPLVSGAQG